MLAGLMGDSVIKETLKSLSSSNGWSYGVFWRFDQKNSLLTLQDVYCGEEAEDVIEDVLLQVHIIGQGVIGQVAFTNEHRWIFSDSHLGIQDHSEFHHQFSTGIKTIVVISVERMGVVQFGSTQKREERLDFVSQTKDSFQSIQILQGLASSINEPLSSNVDAWDSCELFASLISCQSSHFASPEFQHVDRFQDFMETDFSLANISESFPSTSEYQRMGSLVTASPLCEKRLRITNAEAQVDSNGIESTVQSQQSDLVSGRFFELSASQCPRNSTGNNYNIQESSMSNSAHNSDLFIAMENTSQQISKNEMSTQNFDLLMHSREHQLEIPSNLCTFEECSKIDFSKALSRHCTDDDLFQWFSSMTDQSIETMTDTLTNDQSHASEVLSLSSNPREHHTTANFILDNQPSISVQSSVTNALNSAEKAECSDTVGIDKRLHCSGVNTESKSPRDWEDIIMPAEIGGHLGFKASSSDSKSRQYVDSKLRTSSTLFSKLGLHQRLDEIARYDFKEDQLSSTAKRRKIESSLLNSNEVRCHPQFVGNLNSAEPVYHLNSSKNFESKDKDIRRLEAGSCIADNCSIMAGKTVSSVKKPEQPAKTIKKKAKPGTKPRPKDRQQIHDRLLELRELIPNAEKMSIDRLLHLTIKHLLFLQSVTRYAEIFQPTEEKKSVMVWKDNHKCSGGVTWACEVGDQTMICPLIVEDLGVPGQMLIEILCEEQGFFLEIVDIVQGFGLTILKGVMELRETKIWARFNVVTQENLRVTRHEVFSSLVQLLNLTGPTPTGFHKSEQLDNVMHGKASLFNSCQQSAVPHSVSLARVDA